MMERDAKQTIIIGYTGTGKSTLVRNIIDGYTSLPGKKALIVTPDPVEWNDIEETKLTKPSHFEFEGIKKYVWDEDDKVAVLAMLKIKRFYFDGMLIFDDCRAYLDATTPPWLKYFYIRRRQKMIDVMLVGHGFTDIPPKAFTNCSDLFLFMTKDNFSSRKKDLVRYDELVLHQSRVNSKAMDQQKAWTKSKLIEDNKHYMERIIF